MKSLSYRGIATESKITSLLRNRHRFSTSIPAPLRPTIAPRPFSTKFQLLSQGSRKGAAVQLSNHTERSFYTVSVVAAGSLLIGLFIRTLYSNSPPTSPPSSSPESLSSAPFSPEMPVPPGHLGNLTADQEAKLRVFWAVTLKTFGVTDPSVSNGPATDPSHTPAAAAERAESVSSLKPEKEKEKKKKRISSMFGKKHDVEKASATVEAENSTASAPALSATDDDKYGQVKEFQTIIATESPEDLRKTFWGMVKQDHPDALLLRFLRARKWDVDKALVMLISTMHWRSTEMQVDSDVIQHGEGGALEDSHSKDAKAKKEGEDFLAQLRLGKSFLHGTDKDGRPLCVVRVRLHKPGEQSERSMEKYTVYVIETARLALKDPIETAVSFFELRCARVRLTVLVHHF